MKLIQEMPAIWDNQEFFVSREGVLGMLACWAVRQSPYLMPKNLVEGLTQFDQNFNQSDQCITTSCKKLKQLIRQTFDLCPIILSWNMPEKGEHQMVCLSRYDRPAPDFDFIDLDALARNVAHGITLQAKYEQLHRK